MKRIDSIFLIGKYDGQRVSIEINDSPVRLREKAFLYLFKLAWARAHSEDGWLSYGQIEVGHNQSRYLYRLRSELKDQGWDTEKLIENDHMGNYRLNVHCLGIHFDADGLSQFPDVAVSGHFRKSVV